MPVQTDIVLVGAGHAHVEVMRAFGVLPEPGVRLTIVAAELEMPYSGMIPAHVAGLCSREDCHIDIVRLAAATGARLVHGRAVGLDRADKRLLLDGRAPLAYDVLSLNVGSVTAAAGIAGARERAIALRPISSLMARMETLLADMRRPDGPRRIAMVGGGAAGVEILLAVRTRLLAGLREAGLDADAPRFVLVSATDILPTHSSGARAAFRRKFAALGIEVIAGLRATAIDERGLALADGSTVEADTVLLATQAAPVDWFKSTGLSTDDAGFLAVDRRLQVVNDQDVFAVGDCATMVETPREKNGVQAVRQGPHLAENLRRRALGEELAAYRPQRTALALVTTGERRAIASWGPISFGGAPVWRWKNRIDREWLGRYRMSAPVQRIPRVAGTAVGAPLVSGGAAAKVAPVALAGALARLQAFRPGAPGMADAGTDDASIHMSPADEAVAQSVAFMPACLDDAYAFGAVAAAHALNNVLAAGGRPSRSHLIATVPAGSDAKVEEALFQLIAGAADRLGRDEVAISVGHSAIGPALGLGVAIEGPVAADILKRRRRTSLPSRLVLTRPIGSGLLFEGIGGVATRAAWLESMLAELVASNVAAAGILASHGANAVTDVGGFGLVGALRDLALRTGHSLHLETGKIPIFDGALELAGSGTRTSADVANAALADRLRGEADEALLALLRDPQTAGGFLAAVPADRCEACVAALRAAGYRQSAAIGTFFPVDLTGEAIVRLAG